MLFLHGAGHFHPENVIDNDFLESLDIGTDANWTLQRVGIRKRRTVLPLDYIRHTRNANPREAEEAALYSNAKTGAMAARMAIERAGLRPEDIGLVVAGGCSPQFSTPAEASVIAAELGIEAPAFDMGTACSSFGTQLHFLSKMEPSALPPYVLVVNPENNTRTVDYNDRKTAVLWGDATSAVVISSQVPGPWRFCCSDFKTDPKGWDKVKIARGGHFVQDGAAVQKFAISKSVSMISDLDQRCNQPGDAFYFIGHQGNLRLLGSICKRMNIDGERHLFNVDEYGNGGAAGAPSVFSQNWDRFREGDRIVMVIVGAGLAWSGMVLSREAA
ncbi:Ketoacyl-ACP synthase III [Sulfidibacter corallicola]|uniref:Ketoacyl-ACP synthase III n=1 Tax=Sulfidibacter corallicola TaxID=2818388 RepID=A0A8A4TXZ0_SULCO|nr:ketoacyl-ACP synthase III [Sulfidibacter corallicola]QTD51395.1 ketoacyl-ACP synthase III [Sulfidibacter corallicola]